ncbi:GH92 family glycosyl hydrolase [Tamlana fucoidanivorans]|uniref:Glycoside hydrolase family 92 protein n=1 Tax=Allotamlana fucoidanivorans TaxID=2583814 RepID=A0A5C4SMV9_9FLAO|nr:GH92 family glycosyl hydrolase [Tamlana fucoidanivorans]TNJ44910.1 glycoside hydrolase family 92 protein [Tamlana fucoidanivorans]
MKRLTVLLLFSIGLFSKIWGQEDFTKYIDPTIGNVSRFLVPTYPTMHQPNQMLRMFPVKKDYISDEVEAFPLQVISHRRPGSIQMKAFSGYDIQKTQNQSMIIDHDLEVYHPWFYQTYLIEDNIKVSFTPGKKAAIYKIEFLEQNLKTLMFKGKGANKMTLAIHENGTFSMAETVEELTRGTNPKRKLVKVYAHALLVNENNETMQLNKVDTTNSKFLIQFKGDSIVYLKYAISYISHEQAKINLEKELSGVDFNDLQASAKKSWDKVTNQIQVEGGTEAQKRAFYTALYRTYERMVDINEYGQYFSGYDNKTHKSNSSFYVDDWVWDTYRAHHPLRTILTPSMEEEMLDSYVKMYEQSGWMPTFPIVDGNSMCMNSYHSSALFLDAYRKGLKDYDIEKAYQGIKKNLTQGTFIPWRQGYPKETIDDFYHENGFYPALHPGEKETIANMDGFEKRQAVAVSLGISFDFWVLSELAKELGENKEAKAFSEKGNNYKKLWRDEYKLFMPKDDKGNWIDINPKSAGGRGYRDYYDENNGWTYAWDVQQDIQGLINLLGGKEQAEARLDQMFREPLGMRKNEFFLDGSNSTGMVGQFSMGNEPSFHIPYLYNYFGAPWKTQKKTRFLLDVWFKDNVFGVPGDEDGGGMSAFVVFSSMGLYPTTPGLPFYDITSPIFEKTSIKLENGKTFTVLAEGASKKKKYIQKAFLNGKEITSPFITHKQIMDGATLKLVLGAMPNKEWGKHTSLPKY